MVALLKSSASRQEKASACNRNGATSDEHFRDAVIFHRCADMDATGTKHLDSLLDDDGLTAGCKPVTNQIGDSAARARASGSIFSSIELHPRMPICSRVRICASNAVEELCPGAFEMRASALLRNPQTGCDLDRSQQNNAERHSCRDDLCRQVRIEIVDGEVKCCGHRSSVLAAVHGRAEGWVILLHGAEDSILAGLWWCEADGNRDDPEVERDLRSSAEEEVIPIEPTGGAERGMAGKGNLFGSEEDANVNTAFAFKLRCTRKNEGGFAEVGLASEGLHLRGGEAARIWKNGERIAFEGTLGEDVYLCEVEATLCRERSCR